MTELKFVLAVFWGLENVAVTILAFMFYVLISIEDGVKGLKKSHFGIVTSVISFSWISYYQIFLK